GRARNALVIVKVTPWRPMTRRGAYASMIPTTAASEPNAHHVGAPQPRNATAEVAPTAATPVVARMTRAGFTGARDSPLPVDGGPRRSVPLVCVGGGDRSPVSRYRPGHRGCHTDARDDQEESREQIYHPLTHRSSPWGS